MKRLAFLLVIPLAAQAQNIPAHQLTITAANIVALFSGCSGTQYLGADGACHASGSSGFPITLGSTSIGASSTTTSLSGMTLVNANLTTPTALTLTFANGLPLGTGVVGFLPHANIAATAVTPGPYTNANITIAADGSITAAANGSSGGAVSSVSNSDSTLTISPTTGTVVASLNLGNANTWTAPITVAPSAGNAGLIALAGNTAVPSLGTNVFGLYGPNSASFTSFAWQAPTATNASAGLVHVGANSGGVSQLTISNVANADLANPATTVNSQTCTLGSTCTIPFQTNAVSNTSQAGINVTNSSTNSVGLTATASNPSTNVVKYEIAGTYTGTYAGAAGSVANALTANNSNSGAASGSTYNGSAAVTVSTNTIGAGSLANANTWSASNTFSAAGAASTPPLVVSGTPFAGTTGNSFCSNWTSWGTPATLTTLSTSGCALGVAAPSGFAGHLFDLFTAATDEFWVASNGQATATALVVGATYGINSSGFIKGSGYQSVGTKFTATGCTSITSTVGGGTAGKFTIGAGTCTVVITMNGATGLTATNGWSCRANDETTAAGNTGLYFSTNNTTTATLTVPATAAASDVIDFACTGY